MTQDEIIRMAREAGFGWHTPSEQIIVRHSNGSWVGIEEPLERFAALVSAHERELCAKVAESIVTKQSKHINDGKPFYAHMYWEDIAAAIRARGEK